METTNVLCEKKEQIILSNLFEDLKTLLQDSDALEEKEKVKSSLKKMTDTTTYIILGNTGVGKTNLLNAVFQGMTSFSDNLEGELCEYRWGEQELLTPLINGMQKKFVTSDNMRGLSIIDTKGVDRILPETKEKIREQIEKSSAIFVVFDANNIRSPKLWDIIEGCPEKRMIFFLTKCDLISEEDLEKNIEKIQKYMLESGISAPLFPISTVSDHLTQRMISLNDARMHIRENVVGKNPMLNKQMENIEEMKKIIIQLKNSFSLRKQQYISDYAILQKINQSLDKYMMDHKKTLNQFLEIIKREINNDIDSYEHEIISKLDPYKIKERFRKREDFEDYLNMVNENYKTNMNNSVNQKTIEIIKTCLNDLEIVFKEAVGYFNKRENLLELNDKFYGSLSSSRRQMVNETKNAVVTTGELYHTLSEASETLFMQIWDARKKYDTQIRKRRTFSVASGLGGGSAAALLATQVTVGGTAAASTATAAAGTAVAAGAAGSTAAAGTTIAATLGTGGTALLIIVAAIAGAWVINKLAKTIFDPKAADKMEETVQRCIEDFKIEVNKTKTQMIEQITQQITMIFESELASVDSCFTEFRMSVNIDEKKIPVLEQHLEEVEELLMKVERINYIGEKDNEYN